jgi:uncharacterized membrane protein YhhN
MLSAWVALLIMAPVLAALAIRAEQIGARTQVYLFKPLTTICILLIALLAPPPFRPGYHIPIVLGLLFSLIGDVLLMLPRDRFLAGLASFLIALLCYLAAFVNVAGYPTSPPIAILLLVYGLWLLRRLWPRLGTHRWPVMVYATVLLLMCAASFNQLWQDPAPRTWFGFAGAVLFVTSDSMLALDRFVTRDRQRRGLVLASYFAAQWLIAVSVTRDAWWSSLPMFA